MSDTAIWTERLEQIRNVIDADISRRRYHGAVVTVARKGHVALQLVTGTADRDRQKPLSANSVFSIFSVTKAITNVLALRAMELGRFALTTKVSEIIPEFAGGLRQHITVFHLMTHSSGLPMVWTPKAGMYIDQFDEVVAAVIEHVHAVEPAGEHAAYSPMANHVLLGECLRRTDPGRRGYRRIVEEDLFGPLAMKDSAIGLRRDLKSRHVVPDFQGNVAAQHPGHNNLGRDGAFEEEFAEMPWVGAVSTVPDMYRFAEMLRRGGELDGVRILSPASLQLATRNWTGEKPNELYKVLAHKRSWEPAPAYIGLGFSLRGTSVCHSIFGTLASARTFGNYGAGSAMYWVDPERELTFVCLTAGVLESNDNIERFQQLSDLVSSAAI